MKTQNQIKRTLSRPENLDEIRQMLACPGGLRRSVLADDVCERFGFLGRANDPPPGHQLMWQGYFQWQLMCEGYSLRNDQEFRRVFGVRTVKWHTTSLVAVRLGAMSLVGIRRRGHRHERRVCALGMIPPERTPHQTSLG